MLFAAYIHQGKGWWKERGEEKGKKRDEGKRDEGMVNLEIVPPPIVLA